MPETGGRPNTYYKSHYHVLSSPAEKPVLQSRHSLDGSRPAGKVEAAQPLWITLALKKQKGFREQQATREERKQAREAKQAEKLSKENVSNPVFSFNFAFPGLALL